MGKHAAATDDAAASSIIGAVPTPWRDMLLVCRKCSRKLDGGFGHKGREKLRAVLRPVLKAAGLRRQIRVVETACFGVCPKQAVTVVRASDPTEALVIPQGLPAQQVLARAFPPPPAPAEPVTALPGGNRMR